MNVLWFIFLVLLHSCSAQQFYDPTSCSSDTFQPGSRYTCNSFTNSCQTFIVYRATEHFQTISDISNLFGTSLSELLQLNNLISPTLELTVGRDVLVPINCFCSRKFFQSNITYTVSELKTYSEIACLVFEGLVKSLTLFEENPAAEQDLKLGDKLYVPLKCACPDNFTSENGVKFLVTYPFIEGDGTIILSKKFGLPPEDIWALNNLNPRPTVYPNTTVLVPLKHYPVLNLNLSDTQAPIPAFLPTVPIERTNKNSRRVRNLLIGLLVVGILLVLLAFIAGGLFYFKTLRKCKCEKLQPSISTPRSSPMSCLSPDLLSMFKYSLYTYRMDELKRATKDFSGETELSSYVFRGRIGDLEVMIKQMRYEDTRRVIDIYSKINHINIVKLLGVCYGDNVDYSTCYLVFEFARNGCLRNCLSNKTCVLQWKQRTQIAFDIAAGLHYLHNCTVSSYVHMNLNTRNVLITEDWRAKIANFKDTALVGSSKVKGNMLTSEIEAWVAPECLVHGLVSAKVDIFAFGVVLLELMSAQEAPLERNFLFKEKIGEADGESSYFEELKGFIDPCLKGNYPIPEALCLGVLAKACTEDEPLHRPSTNDILKVLVRMI